MSKQEMQIARVKDNDDKQNAYRTQMKRYKAALENEFYFEALLIVYAMMEDRFRSFLYHIGAVRQTTDSKLNVSKTKKLLRRMYFGSDENAEGKKMDLLQISCKMNIIRATINWVEETEGTPEDKYLAIMKSVYEGRLDMGGLIDTLKDIDEWRKYRNEIIHSLLNKNVDSVNSELRKQVESGMKYARFIDSQVDRLKKNKKSIIREEMKIKD